MKKAIVTGANGFAGAAVCRELSDNGMEVFAVIKNKDEKVSSIENLPGLRIIYCELKDFGRLHEIIQDRDIDILYHFAWTGSSGRMRGDEKIQTDNIRYTLDTVKACSQMHCRRFVFAGSIMEYEVQASMMTEKKHSLNTLYAISKLSCDYMARVLTENLGIDYIRCIISNIYGPGEISPRLVNSSLRKMIKGEHCSFSAGDQIYDFIYISDAAKAFVQAGMKGISGRTYYIGSLNPKPLKEFIMQMRDETDAGLSLGFGEIPFDGVSLTYTEFDIEMLMRDTGFIPEVSFADGIRRTAEWIREEC